MENLDSAGKTVKWGQYLRAPDVYFEILEKCKDNLVPLKEVADVGFGIKTGINEFFHLTHEKIEHWNIEDEFLYPLLTSPKEIETLYIDSNNIEFKVFVCSKTKKELRNARQLGALKYIEWGEKQRTKERGGHKKGGTPFPEVPSVQGRPFWYDLGKNVSCDFVVNRFIGERFFFSINKTGALIGDVAFVADLKNRKDIDIFSAILNSTTISLFVEISGRAGLGEGLLTFYGPDIVDLPVIDPNKISTEKKKVIIKSFEQLSTRPILPIFEEVKMKDRQKLDSLVLEAIGLDPKKYLKPIYDGLCELVRERIGLAGMRKNVKKAKTEKDVEKLIEQVANETIPNGARRFPDEFIDSRYLKDAKEISIPNEPLKLGSYFMGQQEIVSEGGFKYNASSLEEAKFIIYSQKPNSYIIKLPKDKIRITKSVDEYERYIKGLKDELFQAFFTRTHDHKLAETLVARVTEGAGMREM